MCISIQVVLTKDFHEGLEAFRWKFLRLHLHWEVVAQDSEGVVIIFAMGGDAFATYLRVTRGGEVGDDQGPVPDVLLKCCREHAALPLQLHVALPVPGEQRTWALFGGGEAFQKILLESPERWRRHMLGEVDVAAWIQRHGGPSDLQIRTRHGWPYALIDGEPLKVDGVGAFPLDDPPLYPAELCRSVTASDECWILTCECSVPACQGIHSGLLVVHQGDFTLWRSPGHPENPLAIFDRKRYGRTVLDAVRRLLKRVPQYTSLNWTAQIDPKSLRICLSRARWEMGW